ncbi:MAG: 4Fe-4S dicluster domain-containing protein [Methanocellales archaeon]
MGTKFLAADPALCIGCHTCELVCSYKKENVFNPKKARIKAVSIPPLTSAQACRLCKPAPCLIKCPRRAITQDEKTLVIKINEDKCDGCGWCVEACEFGAMSMHLDRKKAFVCDLCDGKPACLEFCPTKAIDFVSEEELARKVQSAFSIVKGV